MTTTSFRGFGPRALPFFKALAFHQDRAWFAENRAIYEDEVLGPLKAFVGDLSLACEARGLPLRGSPQGSIFRIHRDVRFSKDKQPYKTHAGAVLTRSGSKSDPGLFYLHVAPDGCFCAAGFYDPPAPALRALREAMAGTPAAALALLDQLAERKLDLDRQWSLKRAPREAAGLSDERLVAAMKLTSLVTRRPIAEASIHGASLVGDCAAFIDDALPLLEYGWAALAKVPPSRS